MYNFPRPAGHNNGGLIQFWFVPLAWVLSVPADVNSAIFGNIVLAAGRKFLTGYASFGKLSYKEPDDDSANGTLYNQGLSGKCPCDNPVLTDLFRIMKYDNRYLVIYKDVNDNFKLAGSLTEPLRFSYELKKGSAFADYNGYEYSFACKSTKPSLFYHGTFETDATVYDNSLSTKVQAAPFSEKQKIAEIFGSAFNLCNTADPVQEYAHFVFAESGFVKEILAVENVSSIDAVYKVLQPNDQYYYPILLDGPYVAKEPVNFNGNINVTKGDTLLVKFSRTDTALSGTVQLRGFYNARTSVLVNADDEGSGDPGRFLVRLNYYDRTLTVIDLDLVTASNYAGAGVWTNNIVLATIALPAVSIGSTYWERMVYNYRQKRVYLMARYEWTTLNLDPDSPMFLQLWNFDETVQNGLTVPELGENYQRTGMVYIEGETEADDRIIIGGNGSYAYLNILKYPFTQCYYSKHYAEGERLYFEPYTRTLQATDSFATFFFDENIMPLGWKRGALSGIYKYYPPTGFLMGQWNTQIQALHPINYTWYARPVLGGNSPSNPVITKEGKFFTAARANNNIYIIDCTLLEPESESTDWDAWYQSQVIVAKGNPDVNELGTRDLMYSRRCNLVVAQGLRNGGQTTGLTRIHFFDSVSGAYIGFQSGGNLDARTGDNQYMGNQMIINTKWI